MDRLLKLFFVLLFFNCQSLLGLEETKLIAHVKECLEKAQNNHSKLPTEILNLPGLSGKKTRHFLNNLCSLPKTRYLEIGCWKGSTFISALYGNKNSIEEAIGIDNWSEFNGPYLEFCNNCSKFIGDLNFHFYSIDAFAMPKQAIFKNPINIYFYDGNHSVYSQELALTYYNEILESPFILIVDDWNWEHVRQGTFNAIKKLNYKILFQKEIFAEDYNCDLEHWNSGTCNYETWWNGLFIAVIKKS